MTRQTYKQAYEAAKLELLQRLQKRDQLDQQIQKLRKTLTVLGDLCGVDPERSTNCY
jgi:hypothetical protein